jgi:3-oxoadipate enol-lactonase
VPPLERSYTRAGRSFRYLESGAGHPCVLLHAFPLSADMWRPQLDDPAPGWRLIAPDFRGFRGPASPPALPVGPMAMDDYAKDVIALLDALELRTAVVCGLSMGGYVAFALWRLAPHRLRGLVLADTRAGADTEEGRAKRGEMLALLKREGAAGVATQMLPNLLGKTTHQSRPEIVTRVRQLIEANSSPAIAAAIGALRDRFDARPLLPGICMPMRLIVGAEDTLTPPDLSDEMRLQLPDADLTVIHEAGHLSNLEVPWLFSGTLTAYLTSLR